MGKSQPRCRSMRMQIQAFVKYVRPPAGMTIPLPRHVRAGPAKFSVARAISARTSASLRDRDSRGGLAFVGTLWRAVALALLGPALGVVRGIRRPPARRQ